MTIRLHQAREAAGMTQQAAADALGITRGSYARYEGGVREPDYDMLVKVAQLFNVSTDYLLGLTDIPNIYVTTGVGQYDATVYTTEKSLSPQEQEQAALSIDEALNGGTVSVSPEMRQAIEQIVRQVLSEQDKQV